jgi:hypothetical protein
MPKDDDPFGGRNTRYPPRDRNKQKPDEARNDVGLVKTKGDKIMATAVNQDPAVLHNGVFQQLGTPASAEGFQVEGIRFR